MKRIYKSKSPTIKQLQNISENLQRIFKCYATAGVEVHSHPGHDSEIRYGLYIASDNQATHSFASWSELLHYYQKLIKEAKYDS